MAQPHQHAEAALEHLISALYDAGVKISTYSQGVGSPAGMDYRDGWSTIANCCWHDGLNFELEVPQRLRLLIRAHCSLYYALFPIEGG